MQKVAEQHFQMFYQSDFWLTHSLIMNLIALVRCECMSVELVFVCVPLDEFDGFKCFVHVPYSEVEAEVQHGVSGLFLTAL